MLFVFPEETEHSFWMKNTLIPLDMLFIAARRPHRRHPRRRRAALHRRRSSVGQPSTLRARGERRLGRAPRRPRRRPGRAPRRARTRRDARLRSTPGCSAAAGGAGSPSREPLSCAPHAWTRASRRRAAETLEALEADGRLLRLPGDRWALPAQAGLVAGRLTMNPAGFGFVQPDDAGAGRRPRRRARGSAARCTATACWSGSAGAAAPAAPRGRIVRVLARGLETLLGGLPPGARRRRARARRTRGSRRRSWSWRGRRRRARATATWCWPAS